MNVTIELILHTYRIMNNDPVYLFSIKTHGHWRNLVQNIPFSSSACPEVEKTKQSSAMYAFQNLGSINMKQTFSSNYLL